MPDGLTTASHRATGATRVERPRRAGRRGSRRGRPVRRGLFERPGHLPFRGSVRERDRGVRVAEPFADPLSHSAVSDRGVRLPRQQEVDGRGIRGLGRLVVDTPKENYEDDEVKVVSLPGCDGPLCRKITVQVEFWKLVYGVANGADGDRLSDGTRPTTTSTSAG